MTREELEECLKGLPESSKTATVDVYVNEYLVADVTNVRYSEGRVVIETEETKEEQE